MRGRAGSRHRSLAALYWIIILVWSFAIHVFVLGEIEATEQQQKQSKSSEQDDLAVAKQLLDSGIHSRNVGNIAGAISSLHKAVLLYQKSALDLANTDVLADAYYNLAETYALSETAAEQSEQYYRQALRLYAQLEDESAKLRWAYCLNRLGVILIERFNKNQPDKIQGLLQNGFHGDWNNEDVLQTLMNQIDLSIPKQAFGYFDDAARVFRSFIEEKGTNREIQQALATSLQNMAAASTTLGNIQKAISCLEESVRIYEELLRQEVESDTAQGMAEAFYSMADLYLQQGAYEMAKDRYRRSNDGLGDFDWSEQVIELENALEEYMSLDADEASLYGDEANYFGEEYSMKDPGYEGDLHTNLGSLYLAQGDTVLAASHLQQAVRKYEILGEANTHNMATAKFNMALLYFKRSEFSLSATSYAEAIDIFRLVGTEFGPIHIEDLEDQLQEALQSQIQPMGKDENGFEETLESDNAGVLASAEDSTPTLDRDTASGLFVDIEHFRSQSSNESLSDEL